MGSGDLSHNARPRTLRRVSPNAAGYVTRARHDACPRTLLERTHIVGRLCERRPDRPWPRKVPHPSVAHLEVGRFACPRRIEWT